MENTGIQKVKKLQIPKKVKQLVWNTYIGEEKGVSQCFCCNTTKISQMDFVCGHVQSEANGGSISVDNLKPICGLCNSSMGTTNMDEFMEAHNLGKQHRLDIVTVKSIVPINAYYCKCCKYYTIVLSNYKVHLASKKHAENCIIDGNNLGKKFKKIQIFCCDTCDNFYMSNQALKKHKNKCTKIAVIEDLENKIKELKHELEAKK